MKGEKIDELKEVESLKDSSEKEKIDELKEVESLKASEREKIDEEASERLTN